MSGAARQRSGSKGQGCRPGDGTRGSDSAGLSEPCRGPVEARLGFSGEFPGQRLRGLCGALQRLFAVLWFSQPADLAVGAAWQVRELPSPPGPPPEALRRSEGWQASGAGGQGRRFQLSVGCRVSRVATLPATPDTDTVGLHDNIPEGWRQHPGGVATTSRRGKTHD